MKRRAKWLAMYSVSVAIGSCVLAFRYAQAAADARLYWHPGPVRALLLTARKHANEYAGHEQRPSAVDHD